jgi:hypothetical protein
VPRSVIALVFGLPAFVAYVVAAATLADRVNTLHWAIQALYFLVAGVLWAWPAYWLIIWASRK